MATGLSRYRGIFGPLAVVGIFLLGARFSPFEPHRPPADPSGAPSGEATWVDDDWSTLEGLLLGALVAGHDTLPMGDLMAELGLQLVGTAYVPGTLEVEGPERVVVNLRGLDCVTFVESVYAAAVLLKTGVESRIEDRAAVESEFERALRAVRYRGNVIDGYASRLHYFSEWIADGEKKLLMMDVTSELGGALDDEPIDFMSRHPDAYRQLADPEQLELIREHEARLSTLPRHVITESEIAEAAAGIRTGDIIAATSTVSGLDVAHTGLAVRVDGRLRLLHAPLVGEAVQLSEESLAERILRIEGQDGIMVARPAEPRTNSSLSGRR